MLKNNKVSVIGSGSWGTAIATVLALNGYDVYLWGHLDSHVSALENDRENKEFLPGVPLPDNIIPTSSLEQCCQGCECICMVVPCQFFRSVFQELLPFVEQGTNFVTASKGVENDSLKVMSQVMSECFSSAPKAPENVTISVLSGPSFAKEVAMKVPTAITLGCNEIEVARKLQQVFGTEFFRVYASSDVIGLEISGALKNVVALAAGICDGLGYGLNTRAALVTRGLVEIRRLGMALGADPHTFAGLSGLGDLMLTCTGDLSRNRQVGMKLGQGRKLQEILDEMHMVAEGVRTTKSAFELVSEMELEMPILEQVYKILYEDKKPQKAVIDLLSREMKEE